PCLMGCYGIGVNRILAATIELGHDDNGCVLPPTIAPFEVEVLQLGGGEQVVETARRIHDELSEAGVDVLLDDRDARPGVKFNDADLIGIPLRVVVGERGLKEGNVEIKRPTDAEATIVLVADAVAETRRILGEMLSPLQG
ncbi:MAG: His/Gly/Thr/Pro-type tRNA ligase C-terminal domain-containing protein, partial [Planctomycetota bacterium]